MTAGSGSSCSSATVSASPTIAPYGFDVVSVRVIEDARVGSRIGPAKRTA
jgi:hypothetical protein